MSIGREFIACLVFFLLSNTTLSSIEPFFRTLGPKLVALDLRNVNEDIFTIICDRFSSLTKLQDLKMDITCGCWDWDGRGSPQQGPSELFVFPRIGKNLRSFGLIVSDTTVSPSKSGPLDLVDAKKLEKLVLYVNHWWVCIIWSLSRIELAQAMLTAQSAKSSCFKRFRHQITHLWFI